MALLLALATAGAGCGAPFEPHERIQAAERAMRGGDLDGAFEIAREGLGRTRGDPATHTRFRLLRAELLLIRGGLEDIGEAELVIAETYGAAASEPALRARWHLLRGYARLRRSQPEQALAPLREAESLAARESLPEIAIDALSLEGQVFLGLRRYPEAERRFRSALDLAVESGNRFQRAASRLNLSLPCMHGRRFDEAIDHLEEGAELARLENADLLQAAILGNLSMCFREVGDLDRAVEAGLQAVEASRRAGVTVYVCQQLGMLGQIQQSRGEFESAVASLREAVAIARDLGRPGDTALWSLELAKTLIRAGELREAAAWIDGARAAYRDTGNVPGLAESDLAEAALAAAQGRDDRVVDLCRGVLETIPDEPSLRWRAEAETARAVLRTGNPDEAREWFARSVEAIRLDRARLSRLESRASFLTLPIAVYRDYVALLLELGLEDEALRAMESSRAQTLLDGLEELPGNLLAVDTLVRLAREHEVALLSYWISPRGSFAWTFTGEGSRRTPLPGAESLTDLVARHRAAIEASWRDPIESDRKEGKQLFRLLVEPVLDVVPAGSRVIVVPDGPLHRLNLETIVAGEPAPHYLIEDWSVAVAPALSMLAVDGVPAAREDRSILLIGDPVESDPDFPRLPHAAGELDAIATRLAGFPLEQLRGAEATVETVLARIDGSHAWIHFAAHAQAGGGNPLDSAVILSPREGRNKLYARELAGRRIGAELVTLSACRTAGSRAFSGEGLVGLSWAFMRAGAPRVIAGLWDVSDRSTVLLMAELYAGLARGDGASDALREAKLRLLRSGTHVSKPYYWGPFQLYTRTPHGGA